MIHLVLDPPLDTGESLEERKYTYINHLVEMKKMLVRMLEEVESGNISPRENRLGGMGRVIADSWGPGSELADLISSAEDAYRQL